MSKYTKIVATLGVITGLGIASLPLATFAAPIPLDGSVPSSQNVVVQLTVGDAVAVAVDSNNVNAGNVSPNQTKNVSTTVSYATNHNTGMTLTVKDLDEDTDMTAGLSGSPVAGTNVISAGTNGNVAGTGNWSIKGGLLTSPTAMVKQSQTALKVQESNAPVNTTVNIDYDFSTGASQLPGTYQDTIVYTAAVK
jgi:hypothetical protein